MAAAALGATGNDGSSEGPERSEGAAKRLDAPFPAAHAASHFCLNGVIPDKTRYTISRRGSGVFRAGGRLS